MWQIVLLVCDVKNLNHHMSIYQHVMPSFKACFWARHWQRFWYIKVKEKVNHLIIWHPANQSQEEFYLRKKVGGEYCIPRQTCLISTLWMLKRKISTLVLNVQTPGRPSREKRWLAVWLGKARANLWPHFIVHVLLSHSAFEAAGCTCLWHVLQVIATPHCVWLCILGA